jgi:hypothetical protein
LLDDPAMAAIMGSAARDRVHSTYLADTQLLRWGALLAKLF